MQHPLNRKSFEELFEHNHATSIVMAVVDYRKTPAVAGMGICSHWNDDTIMVDVYDDDKLIESVHISYKNLHIYAGYVLCGIIERPFCTRCNETNYDMKLRKVCDHVIAQ